MENDFSSWDGGSAVELNAGDFGKDKHTVCRYISSKWKCSGWFLYFDNWSVLDFSFCSFTSFYFNAL
jgi:hypothetical protein